MPGNQPGSPAPVPVNFALKIQDFTIEVSTELPEGPALPAAILPIIQGLSNSFSEVAAKRAAQKGRHLSCREGCAACCWQAVAIAPAEARMLSQWLDNQPEERQAALRERFRVAAERLEHAGIAHVARDLARIADRDALHALGLKYSALGIPCPFLEDEKCSIYEIRPLRCREYQVASLPEHCAHPETREIDGIEPPVKLSHILGKWNAAGDPQPAELILLTMLDEWVARHPPKEDRPQHTAPELLHEFIRRFADDPD
jgi:Fe-S-cluster containining protein